MSCVYYESVFCIHLRPIGVCLSRRATPHVLRTRIPDSSEKWWPTGVTPHALRIRFTHSHAQGVGEGLRTTYYAYVLRIPPPNPLYVRALALPLGLP